MTISIIDVYDITKIFDNKTVVDRISLQVHSGEIFGFLGPNGSGKTTFLRMLCGLLKPQTGRGTVLGYDVMKECDAIKAEVGYMTQRFSFYEDLSIQENLEFVAKIYKMPTIKQLVEKALSDLGLIDRRKQLAGQLSGGWKQRLALATCLIHSPKLLLLDEPTAGVDPKARRDFWDQIHILATNGLTILITTHYMDEAERCHRLAYISSGKLLNTGTVDEIICSANLVTYEIKGQNVMQVSKELNKLGIGQAVAFGNCLHLSGPEAQLIERTLQIYKKNEIQWRRINTSLEDVFICNK